MYKSCSVTKVQQRIIAAARSWLIPLQYLYFWCNPLAHRTSVRLGTSLNIPSQKQSGSCIHSHSWSHCYFPITVTSITSPLRIQQHVRKSYTIKNKPNWHPWWWLHQWAKHIKHVYKHNTSGGTESGKPASHNWRSIHWCNTWEVSFHNCGEVEMATCK